jgi:ubiquinone/menaquinone biosynthesis C-methylase UbiE
MNLMPAAGFSARRRQQRQKMRKYAANTDILQRYLPLDKQRIIDVGCGNGDTVRWLAARGARATGLDSREMLEKARSCPPCGTEDYVAGGAQKMPFGDGTADIILYQASFHHVPAEAMAGAGRECRRVLKSGGRAVFVEPVYRAGAYCEVTSLVDDESELLNKSYAVIVSLAGSGLAMEKEEFFYVERSFADYVRLIEFFVADAARRQAILAKARGITERLSSEAGRGFTDFRYRSICRLNLLAKNSS